MVTFFRSGAKMLLQKRLPAWILLRMILSAAVAAHQVRRILIVTREPPVSAWTSTNECIECVKREDGLYMSSLQKSLTLEKQRMLNRNLWHLAMW